MKNLNNLIKFDWSLCSKCNKCVNICPTSCIKNFNNDLDIDFDKCIRCKKCIYNCSTHALIFGINQPINFFKDDVLILPEGANYDSNTENIVRTTLGEKIRIIEISFKLTEMLNLSLKYNKSNFLNPLIISDILATDKVLNNLYPDYYNYFINTLDPYEICADISSKFLFKNKKVYSFGEPFESKLTNSNRVSIDSYIDIPLKYKYKYNALNILDTFMKLNKLKCSVLLSAIKDSTLITLNNDLVSLNVLFIDDYSKLSKMAYFKPDIVFLTTDYNYIKEDIIKDTNVNFIYKKYLKEPLKNYKYFRK